MAFLKNYSGRKTFVPIFSKASGKVCFLKLLYFGQKKRKSTENAKHATSVPPPGEKGPFPFSFCLLHSFLLWRTCGFVLTGRDRLTMETEKKRVERGGEGGKQEQEAPVLDLRRG